MSLNIREKIACPRTNIVAPNFKNMESHLSDLCLIRRTTGEEYPVAEYMKSEFEKMNIAGEIFPNNSFLSEPLGEGECAVVVSAHMDTPAFMVSKFCPTGRIKFVTLGTFFPPHLKQCTLVHFENSDIMGKLIFPDNIEHCRVEDLELDCGFQSETEAKKNLVIGDRFTFSPKFLDQGEYYEGTSIDNSLGCSAILSLASFLKDCPLNYRLYFGGTSSEEMGAWGAQTLGKDIPGLKLCVAIDSIPEIIPHIENEHRCNADTPKVTAGITSVLRAKEYVIAQKFIPYLGEKARQSGIGFQPVFGNGIGGEARRYMTTTVAQTLNIDIMMQDMHCDFEKVYKKDISDAEKFLPLFFDNDLIDLL